MNVLKQLREKKSDVEKRMLELNRKAKEEKRSLSEDETKKWEELVSERDDLESRIKQEEIIDGIIQSRAKKVTTSEEDKVKKQFRFKDAIRASIELRESGKMPTGLVAEMHQEAEREARDANITLAGIGVPNMILQPSAQQRTNVEIYQKEQRAITVAGNAGSTVPTELVGYVEALYARARTIQLGASKITGLTGNVDFPRGTNTLSCSWIGETETSTESDKGFDKYSATPKRCSSYTTMSKQLVIQSSLDVEAYIQEQLILAESLGLESAALIGSGTDMPTGILNTSGIGSVVGGTDGAVPGFDQIIDLETAVASANADVDKMGYLTTPGIKGVLKKTSIETGDATKVWTIGSRELNGYQAEVSTLVPSNLVKGSSSDCHAIIFGNWQDLVYLRWGGLDLIVDPYTSRKEGMIEIQIDSFNDIFIKHSASFAAMLDALLNN